MPLYPGFPLGGSDYTVGTITLTAGSKDFTLTGSNPLDYAAAHAAKVLLIETITNTGGTLIYPCPDDCAGAALPFRLQLKNASSRLQGMAANLLQAIGSGNLAALSDLELQDGQLIAGDAVQGEFKAINASDLQTSLPALLTAIGNLSLSENKLIAGGATAGSVKAISLPPPVDITGKLDKTGGEVTGDLTVQGDLTAPNIYTKAQADDKYLPKAGGTITGDLTINGTLKGEEWQGWGNVQAKDAISAYIEARAATIADEKIATAMADMPTGTTFHTIEMLTSGEIDWPDWVKPDTPVHVMAWAGAVVAAGVVVENVLWDGSSAAILSMMMSSLARAGENPLGVTRLVMAAIPLSVASLPLMVEMVLLAGVSRILIGAVMAAVLQAGKLGAAWRLQNIQPMAAVLVVPLRTTRGNVMCLPVIPIMAAAAG